MTVYIEEKFVCFSKCFTYHHKLKIDLKSEQNI